MKDYVPDDRARAGKKGKKQKKDPNAPKRSMSAYFLYSIDARPKVKAQNPKASFGDVARLISEQFKLLSDKEKKYWDKRAAEDKERYNREMEAYRG
jgi:HMG (high mobility group) box